MMFRRPLIVAGALAWCLCGVPALAQSQQSKIQRNGSRHNRCSRPWRAGLGHESGDQGVARSDDGCGRHLLAVASAGHVHRRCGVVRLPDG